MGTVIPLYKLCNQNKILACRIFFWKFLLCVINDIFLTPDKWTKLSNTYTLPTVGMAFIYKINFK